MPPEARGQSPERPAFHGLHSPANSQEEASHGPGTGHRPAHDQGGARGGGSALLGQFVEAAREEAGNLAFDSYGKTGDRRSYVLLERYASREALDEHRRAPHFTGLLLAQIVPLLETRTVEEYDVPD